MATQTEYLLPVNPPVTLTDGSSTRQWMTGGGVYVNETITSAVTVHRPVVQVCG